MIHSVYVLADEQGARYVGITRQEPHVRWLGHCATAMSMKGGEYRDKSDRARWIRDLADNGEQPRLIVLASGMTPEAAQEAEREIIAEHPEYLNVSGGGQTGRPDGQSWTLAASKVIAAAYRYNPPADVAFVVKRFSGFGDYFDEQAERRGQSGDVWAIMYGAGKIHPACATDSFFERLGELLAAA